MKRVRSEGSKDNSHLRSSQALSHCLSQPPCEAGVIRRLLLAQGEAKVGGSKNFFFFCGTKAHVGFYSPNQGLNLCPIYWKHSLNHWTTREVPQNGLRWFWDMQEERTGESETAGPFSFPASMSVESFIHSANPYSTPLMGWVLFQDFENTAMHRSWALPSPFLWTVTQTGLCSILLWLKQWPQANFCNLLRSP